MASAPFPEIRFLKEKVHALCAGLALRLDEFVDQFPTGIPKQLIQAVQRLLGLLKALADAEDEPDLLVLINTAIVQIDPNQPGLAQSLDWLDNAHTAQTPRGLVQFLRAASRQMGLLGDFLVAPDHELNYSILNFTAIWRELLSDFLDSKELDEVFKGLPNPCYLVRFPRIAREGVLKHSILGHELGHPIADAFLAEYESGPDYQRKEKAVTLKIRSELMAQGLTADQLRLEQIKTFNRVANLHFRALEELISDAVAVYTFGPTAAFAFYDLFTGDDLDSPPSHATKYPPDRYRIRLMYRLLREEGHVDLLKSALRARSYTRVRQSVVATVSHLESIGRKRSDIAELAKDPSTRIAYDWVKDTLPSALAYAKRRVKNFIYSAKLVKRDLPDLLALLAMGIPPAERGVWPKPKPVDWRSSLLAGWCFRLDLISKHTGGGSELEKRLREVSELVLKGVEYSILRDDYAAEYPEALK